MSSQKNKSLMDGFECLQALASADRPLGCRELARMLNMNPTRANRLLMTLEHIGLAQKDEKRKYSPGPGVNILAAQTIHGSRLFQAAMKVLPDVKSDYQLALGLLWKDKINYLFHGHPRGMRSVAHSATYPATNSSIGMILLAELAPEELDSVYGGKEIPQFPDGLESLKAELSKVRTNGFALLEPHGSSMHYNVAVPVGRPALAGLALTAIPTLEETPKALSLLKETAGKIEERLNR